jgi:DNA adenine methylase
MEINNSSNLTQDVEVIPFLKWAGGKRWLVQDLARLIGTVEGSYIEPFLGSAAAFFSIKPERALLSDVNTDLIKTYKVVKSAWRQLYQRLEEHHQRHSKVYYYKIRNTQPTDRIDCAARFIYLNRTCWNGLYRVNLKGEFNVPIGTKSSVVLQTDDFGGAARQLKNAVLSVCDFEISINAAVKGDVIFSDPPYTVRHKFNGFIKYNESLFSWNDQIRLRNALVRAKKRGVRVFLTNADHPSIHELYANHFNISELQRFSAISSSGATRGSFSELLITG